jgi:glycerol transport system substrate-binding protein
MDNLAAQQDRIMERLERAGVFAECGPRLNEEREASYWFDQPGAPKPELGNEKPQGVTVDYDQLLQAWAAGEAMPEGVK